MLRTWDRDDGLSDNRPTKIAQTPDGYLWLIVPGKLVRFDGMRFQDVSDDGGGVPHAMFVSRDGTLWIGDEEGAVRRWRDGHWTTVIPSTNRGRQVTSFAEDRAGRMWHSSGSALRPLEPGDSRSFESPQSPGWTVSPTIRATSGGEIWFAGRGWGIFEGGNFLSLGNQSREPALLTPSRDGGMWVIAGERLLHCTEGGAAQSEVADLTLIGAVRQFTCLLEDQAGNLWIGTRDRGLFRFRDGRFLRVPTSHSCILDVTEDREGNLWVATMGGGLNRLRPSLFALRQTPHGLPNDNVLSLCVDSEDRIWLAADGEGPVRAVDSGNRFFVPVPGLDLPNILTLCADRAGGAWLGTMRGVLHSKRAAILDRHGQATTSLLLDRRNTLWMAGVHTGLTVRNPNGSEQVLAANSGLTLPRALAESENGEIWVGTEGGRVFRGRKGAFLSVPLPGAKPGEPIRFFVPDERDTIWIGSNVGLYRWQAGVITRLSPDSGLPLDDLRALAIGANGDFWIAGGNGLHRVRRAELAACLEGRQTLLRVVTYGRNDGLPSADFAFGFKNTTARTRNGHLWFATYRGALEIKPQSLADSLPLLPVRIEDVRVRGTAIPNAATAAPLTLPPHAGPLQISYTVPEMSEPDRIQFRYRLVGHDGDRWVEAGTQRSATFAQIPPGEYRFEVTARAPLGEWQKTPAAVAFVVKASWRETWWFRLGAGTLIALSLAGGARFLERRRLQAQIRHLEQKNALERERMRLARDLHDQVGANLTQITLLAELATTPECLAQLAESARDAITALDGVVWAANPRNDTLASLAQYLVRFAEDFLRAAGIRCRVDLPAETPPRHLPPEFRHHVLLFVKEALNNAVKHSAAREVRLGTAYDQKCLTLTVSDDGTGFGPGADPSERSGLANMRARAAALGGECRVESDPGIGTRIVFQVPWPGAGPRV